jgi:hypothetical protein
MSAWIGYPQWPGLICVGCTPPLAEVIAESGSTATQPVERSLLLYRSIAIRFLVL